MIWDCRQGWVGYSDSQCQNLTLALDSSPQQIQAPKQLYFFKYRIECYSIWMKIRDSCTLTLISDLWSADLHGVIVLAMYSNAFWVFSWGRLAHHLGKSSEETLLSQWHPLHTMVLSTTPNIRTQLILYPWEDCTVVQGLCFHKLQFWSLMLTPKSKPECFKRTLQ